MGDQARIFISYAHRDGTDQARRLRADLTERGYDAWLDESRLDGGSSWSREIEDTLDAAAVVLALLTRGAVESEICRGEHLRSLRHGKCVIPVLAQRDAEPPIYLEARQYCDLSGADYEARFEGLLRAVESRSGAHLVAQYRETPYDTVPPLPLKFVSRNRELRTLRGTVLSDRDDHRVGVVGLRGTGGFGKSVLAAALCRDSAIQDAFPDGVVWVTIGERPTDATILDGMRETAKALGAATDGFDSLEHGARRIRTLLRDKAALIVLDDVWDAEHVEYFRPEVSRLCRVLFTAREAEIARALGAEEVRLDGLGEAESRQMLSAISERPEERFPPAADGIVKHLGGYALALAMVGATLRDEPDERWSDMLADLRESNLVEVGHRLANYTHAGVIDAIDVSVKRMGPDLGRAFLQLAMLRTDTTIPESVLEVLWEHDGRTVRKYVSELVGRSLASVVSGPWLRPLRRSLSGPGTTRLRSLRGNAAYLTDLIVSRDGTLAVTGSSDRTARAWDLATCRPIGVFGLDKRHGHLRSVSLSPDGSTALVAWDDRLILWKTRTGSALRTVRVRGVTFGALLSDGRHAYIGMQNGAIDVWDLEKRSKLRTLPIADARPIAVSPDDTAIAVETEDTIRILDATTGALMHVLAGARPPVVFSPDGRSVATGMTRPPESDFVQLWDFRSGNPLRAFDDLLWAFDDLPAASLAFSANGTILAGVSGAALRVWDATTGTASGIIAMSGQVTIALAPDAHTALTAGRTGFVKEWDLATGEPIGGRRDGDQLEEPLRTIRDRLASIASSRSRSETIVLADGKRRLMAADWFLANDHLVVQDVESGARLGVLRGAGHINAFDASPDGRFAVTGCTEGVIDVWDIAAGGVVASFATDDAVRDCAWDASTNTIVAQDLSGGLHILRLEGY